MLLKTDGRTFAFSLKICNIVLGEECFMEHESDGEREERVIREGVARRAFIERVAKRGITEDEAKSLFESLCQTLRQHNKRRPED